MFRMINIKKSLKSIYNEYLRYNCFFGSAFMFFDKMTGHYIEKKRFFKNRGYKLDLKNPVSFSEKVVWKKLYDRNPLLTLTADKYSVRSYVKRVLGENEGNKILIPLLFVSENPENIPFDKLPAKYIIKTNHSSGWNIVVNGVDVNPESIILLCRKWLKQCYGLNKNEWAYKNIKRKLLIEELLLDENGDIPKDYKFFVFHGVCTKIMVFSNRNSTQGKSVVTYDCNWNKLQASASHHHIHDIEKPKTLNKMINVAEKLGKDFDFVRVDLYTVKERVFFGELTHYPMSGNNLPATQEKDIDSGKHWNLERNNFWR